jgi:hypothetical protein
MLAWQPHAVLHHPLPWPHFHPSQVVVESLTKPALRLDGILALYVAAQVATAATSAGEVYLQLHLCDTTMMTG